MLTGVSVVACFGHLAGDITGSLVAQKQFDWSKLEKHTGERDHRNDSSIYVFQ